MVDSADKKLEEIKQDRLEKLVEKKVEEKTREKDKKIEKLEKEVEKLKTNSNTVERPSKASNVISRREFLKKASLGVGGLGALLSPVSADYFIKDDSFSVQTSSDGGSTLNEGLFVDQNQNVNIPNGVLNVQGHRAATQTWANNQGWITASEAPVQSVNGQTGAVELDDGSTPPIYGDASDGSINISSNASDGGIYYVNSYTVDSGVTLTINDKALIIIAQNEIKINGDIDGSAINSSNGEKGLIGANGSGGSSTGGDGGPGAGGATSGGHDGQGATAKVQDLSKLRRYESPELQDYIDTRFLGGSAGGKGASYSSTSGGNGGDGGAGLVLCAPQITVSGSIDLSGSDGQDGEDGALHGAGGGGGGSGGLMVLVGESIDDTSTFTATGGVGGAGGTGDAYGDGGHGGDGYDGEKIVIGPS